MSDKVKVALLKNEVYPVMTPELDVVGGEYSKDHEIEIPRELLQRYEEVRTAFELVQDELFSYYYQTAEGRREMDSMKPSTRFPR